MNKQILHGRIGSIDYMDDKNIVNMQIATDDGYIKDGEKVENTNWHKVVAFGKKAEVISNHFNVGDGILIEGTTQKRSYEKEGNKVYVTEVILKNFEFPIKKKESSPF